MAKTVYIVEVVSGSDRQREWLTAMIEAALQAFIYQAKQQHQKNDIKFTKLNEEVKQSGWGWPKGRPRKKKTDGLFNIMPEQWT